MASTDRPSTANGEPRPLRVGRGQLIGGYRIVERLGYGYEGTVYRVRELATGIERALKLYRDDGPETLRHAAHVARVFEALGPTGAVARYHHFGRCLTGHRAAAVYLVFDCVDGPGMVEWLQAAGTVSAATAVAVIDALAKGMVAVHRAGYAVGDMDETGSNVIVTDGLHPVFCDLYVGTPTTPNLDYGADIEALAGIVGRVAQAHHKTRRLAALGAALERKTGAAGPHTLRRLLAPLAQEEGRASRHRNGGPSWPGPPAPRSSGQRARPG